jgi:ERCC4-type nuclease
MKKITHTTQYWLFKEIPSEYEKKYYYVRCMVRGLTAVWFMGYENHMNLVSRIGGDLSEELANKLEAEFQEYIKNNPEEQV